MTLPPIILGAGALNTQYNSDQLDDVKDVLKFAFDHGITAIDTAAFYGPSETLIGEALAALPYKRSEYWLESKACRWETNEFDFSAASVRRSVARSLERLRTDYLDALYVHDVEFGDPKDVLVAIKTAFELKSEGVVRNVGISGLPLDIVLKAAQLAKKELGHSLDFVLSYCNLTLQNDLLLAYESKLHAAGVKNVINASPLSMSLLREEPTHKFHPADDALRARADEIGQKLLQQNENYASVALQYALHAWKGKPTVLGLRTVKEVELALQDLKASADPSADEQKLWSQIIADFGDQHNVVWQEELPKKVKHLWDAVNVDA